MASNVPEAYLETLEDISDLTAELLDQGVDIDPLERDPKIRALAEKANSLMDLVKEIT